MAVLVPRKVLLDGFWAGVDARTALASPAVRAGNRVKTSDPKYPLRLAAGTMPVNFPAIFARTTGSNAPTPPRTFGHGSATTILDYGVPLRLTLEVRLIVDQLKDDVTLPLEAEIEAVLNKLHIDLRTTHRWFGGFTSINQTRRDERSADTANVLRTVMRWTATADCRPKLSAITAQ